MKAKTVKKEPAKTPSKFENIGISKEVVAILRELKEKKGTPIRFFVESAIKEKIERED